MYKFNSPVSKSKALMLVLLLGFVAVISSCNKDFENVLPKEFANDTLGRGAGKKVLLVIMDGVKGSVVKELAPRNITTINANALHTFEGLADDQRNAITNAAAWTNLITGTDYRTHGVQSEDFANLNLQASSTLFKVVKDRLGDFRTASIASSAIFNEKLATDATVKVNAANDAAVSAAAVSELGRADANVVVAQFNGAEIAGVANGYNSANSAYAQAIGAIDGYIGQMLAAIKAREKYSTENWLIVLTSSKGGAASSGGSPTSNVLQDQSRNTYTAFYNPRFTQTLINQPDPNSFPFLGFAPRFTTTAATTGANTLARLSNTSIGNFGTTGDYVIQFKVRNDGTTNLYWPHFFSKNPTLGTLSETGWAFSIAGPSAQIDFGAINGNRPDINTIRDGRWHTIAAKISFINGVRTVSQYSDGVKRGVYTNLVGSRNLNNNSPITIGTATVAAAVNANFLIRDIAIYNMNMTDEQILANMRKEISTDIDYAQNLVGWWPCNEGSGRTLFDKSGNGNNFTITPPSAASAPVWQSFEEQSPLVAGNITDAAFRAIPNNVDVTLLIYNWLNITVLDSWGLRGRLFQPVVTLPTN